MSGIYLLVLTAIWLFAGWIIYRIWLRLKPTELIRKILHVAIGVLLLSVWFGGALWEVAGKKLYWDTKIRELCAKDGGVKVYETVTLSVEMFNNYTDKNWILPNKSQVKSTDEYYLDSEITYLKKGNPSLWQIHHRIIRRFDQRLLGESVMYARSGGDLPGPWHASSFKCPDPSQQPNLESSIFHKEDAK